MRKSVHLRLLHGLTMNSKKTAHIILRIAALGIAAGCIIQSFQKHGNNQICQKQLFAMDTYMTFEAHGKYAEEAVDAAIEEVKKLDALLSTGSASSEVYEINSAGQGTVSEDTARLLKLSEEIYESTDGLFDITVYPLMELWGFPSKSYHVPTETELQRVLTSVGFDKLSFNGKQVLLSEGQKIDFGGIAKGYASGKVIEIFQSYGIEDGLVSLGGNIQTIGVNQEGLPWNIGIRDPKGDQNDIIASVRISGKAVVTSGGYERYFEEDGNTYIHILNPKTGYPADGDLVSATIISKDGALADAMSTSVYLMGLEKAEDYWRAYGEDFEMILMTEDGNIYVTEGISEDFVCQKEFSMIRRTGKR
mgnify:CR=1 FL=1